MIESVLKHQMGMDDLEASFTTIVLLCDLEKDSLTPDEIEIVKSKRDRARSEKDFKTSDYLRGVLERNGETVRDRRA